MQQEKPPQREARTPQLESSPHSLQQEKARTAAKTKHSQKEINKFGEKGVCTSIAGARLQSLVRELRFLMSRDAAKKKQLKRRTFPAPRNHPQHFFHTLPLSSSPEVTFTEGEALFNILTELLNFM